MNEFFKKYNLSNDTTSSIGDLKSFFKCVEDKNIPLLKKYLAEDDFKCHPHYEEILNIAFLYACTSGDKEILKEIIAQDSLDYKNNYPISTYHKGLILCAKNAHLSLIEYLLSNIKLQESHLRQYQINTTLHEACESGQQSVVNYLLNHSEYKLIVDIHSFEDRALKNAIANSHLEIAKTLLNRESFKRKKNIKEYYSTLFLTACYQGDLELLKYIISSDEIKSYADIKELFCLGFTDACLKGRLNVVCYLLTTDGIKDLVNIHTNYDHAFISACKGKHIDVLSFLILEMNIEKTKHIIQALQTEESSPYTDKECLSQVQGLFKLRAEKNRLNTEVKSPNNTTPASVRKL